MGLNVSDAFSSSVHVGIPSVIRVHKLWQKFKLGKNILFLCKMQVHQHSNNYSRFCTTEICMQEPSHSLGCIIYST